MRIVPFTAAVACFSLLAGAAHADPPRADAPVTRFAPSDIREEVPLVGYTTSAFGATARSVGAAGYAGVVGGATGLKESVQPQGGARIWGSPIDRLTLLVAVDRPFAKEAAPSVSALVRIAGSRAQGWAFAGSLTYKTEGFDELAGEMEGSLLFSVAARRMHGDFNVVVGGGLEEREIDGEVKLRVGYDVTSWMRVGADARFRYRLGGDTYLPGNRVGDAVGGPEVMFGYKHFFLAVSGGPSTVGVISGLGWTATSTLGGALFF